MNFLDAITAAKDGDNWIRPVSWKGLKRAYAVDGAYLFSVPGRHGKEMAFAPPVTAMLEEWELIDGHEVNRGK